MLGGACADRPHRHGSVSWGSQRSHRTRTTVRPADGEVQMRCGHRGREPDAAVGRWRGWCRGCSRRGSGGRWTWRAGSGGSRSRRARSARSCPATATRWCSSSPARPGRSRTRCGSCPLRSSPGLSTMPPCATTRLPARDQPDPVLLLADHDASPEPDAPAPGVRRTLGVRRRTAASRVAALNEPVCAIAWRDWKRMIADRVQVPGLAVDRSGVAVQRVQPPLPLRDVDLRAALAGALSGPTSATSSDREHRPSAHHRASP